jgi:mRNA interferase RelE/StbE
LNVEFRSSFARDLKKIKERALLQRVRNAIEQVEQAGSLREASQAQKLRGSESYYQSRIGDYRIGLSIDGENVTFVRILHRRDIYRYSP